jgi:cysteinyl-tRNA synthetase
MANVWMHNAFVDVEDKKMSKSEGNFVTIRELLETENFGGRSWDGPTLRLAMLRTHYRSPIDWTIRGLEESGQIIDSWARAIQPHGIDPQEGIPIVPSEVIRALNDDLNTPQAITAMHGMARAAKTGDAKAAKLLSGAADMLGLQRSKWDRNAEAFIFKAALDDDFDQKFKQLLKQREAARARKDFKESDRIRGELAAMGVVLKDGKDPATGEPTTTWEIAR